MPAKAYVKNKLVHLFYEWPEASNENTVVFNIGASLAGFLRVDIEDIKKLYDEITATALSFKTGRLSALQERQLFNAAEAINKKSPYLRYYTDILVGVLIAVVSGRIYDMSAIFAKLPRTNELYEQYNSRFDEDANNVDAILAPYYPEQYLESRPKQQKIMMLRSINSILYIKDAILLDINEKKELVTELVLLLYGENDTSMTKPQKLVSYDLSKNSEKPFFIDREFKASCAFLSGGGASTELTAEYAAQNAIECYELYTVDWVDDLICLELLKAVQYDALIKKCVNCGRFFAPAGRTDTIYCGELFEGTGKTCSEIGAIKKYRDKTEKSPVHEAFNKAYKRNNSRVRNGKMTKQEFAEWLQGAKSKRAECIDGKISTEEFSKWLGNKMG